MRKSVIVSLCLSDRPDRLLSLIHPCDLSGVSPIDYLTELQRQHEQVRAALADWMPWNCRQRKGDGGLFPGTRPGYDVDHPQVALPREESCRAPAKSCG